MKNSPTLTALFEWLFGATPGKLVTRLRIVSSDGSRVGLVAAFLRGFLRYVDAGHYNGGQFHRTVTMDNQPDNKIRIEVIQASVNAEKGEEGFGPIPLERTTKTGLLPMGRVRIRRIFLPFLMKFLEPH